MRRRPILILAATLLAIAAAVGGFWLWAADRLEVALDGWADQQRAQGNDVAYHSRKISGFPLALRVRIEQPRLASKDGCIWEGPAFTGRADVWRPLLIEVAAPGVHRVSCTAGLDSIEIKPEAAEADGTVTLGYGGQVERAALRFRDVTVGGLLPGVISAKSLDLDVVGNPGRPGGRERRSLAIDAIDLRVPPQIDPVFGNVIARLGLAAELRGAVPASPPKAALARWRDEGGEIEISRFALAWGPVDVRGSGTASLDSALRPVGSFRTSLRGGQRAIDILVERRLIEPKAAGAVRLALFALSRRAEDGGSEVKLPVILRDGLFYLGPVALFPLTPVL